MLVLLLLMCLPPDPQAGVSRQQATKAPITLRDARGRVTGTMTPVAGNIVLRDARGRVTGSVTLRGNQATVRDAKGRATPSGVKNGKR